MGKSTHVVGLLSFIGVVAVTAPVGAQGRPLTLAEAVRLATTVAPAAQRVAGRRAEAVGRARTDAQWANPIVELRRENEGAPIPYDDFATVTLPIGVTGRRVALRSALSATRERATADSVDGIRAAGFDAAHAWWAYWAAREVAAVAEAQGALYDRVARLDSLRAAEGEIAEATALRMRIEAQRALHAAGQARAQAAFARAALAALVGESDPAAIETAKDASVLAASHAALPSVDSALVVALRDRADLRAARAAVTAADRRRTAERLGTLPDVSVTGGYKGTGGFSSTLLGVVVTPPLLNTNGGNRERTFGDWLVADADRRAAELRVSTEVRAAREAVQAIDAGTLGFDDAFVARADVVAAAAEAAYREGAASLVELLDAFRTAADARTARARGIADRAIARLDLRRAIGASAVESP